MSERFYGVEKLNMKMANYVILCDTKFLPFNGTGSKCY